ncbi:hypothetical protein ACFQZ8_04615, partial [Micromonospora azadirachtae]
MTDTVPAGGLLRGTACDHRCAVDLGAAGWGRLCHVSPVSRGRRRTTKKRSVRGGAPLVVVGEPEECDCPYCAGGQVTPDAARGLASDAVDLDAMQEPLDLEIAASMFLAIGGAVGDDFDRALREQFVPTFEAQAIPAARAMLA